MTKPKPYVLLPRFNPANQPFQLRIDYEIFLRFWAIAADSEAEKDFNYSFERVRSALMPAGLPPLPSFHPQFSSEEVKTLTTGKLARLFALLPDLPFNYLSKDLLWILQNYDISNFANYLTHRDKHFESVQRSINYRNSLREAEKIQLTQSSEKLGEQQLQLSSGSEALSLSILCLKESQQEMTQPKPCHLEEPALTVKEILALRRQR